MQVVKQISGSVAQSGCDLWKIQNLNFLKNEKKCVKWKLKKTSKIENLRNLKALVVKQTSGSVVAQSGCDLWQIPNLNFLKNKKKFVMENSKTCKIEN